jgi:hypothetical protein
MKLTAAVAGAEDSGTAAGGSSIIHDAWFATMMRRHTSILRAARVIVGRAGVGVMRCGSRSGTWVHCLIGNEATHTPAPRITSVCVLGSRKVHSDARLTPGFNYLTLPQDPRTTLSDGNYRDTHALIARALWTLCSRYKSESRATGKKEEF